MAFISTSPAFLKDPTRLAELASTGLLDSPAEESFDRLTKLVSKALNCPVSLVSLVDQDRQFFKSQIGLPKPWSDTRETPLTHSFCQHVIETAQPLRITDAREHHILKENLAIPDIGVIAYMGMPLITRSGHTLGSLCAIDSQPHDWSDDDVFILHNIAALVLREIETRATAKEYRLNLLALEHLEEQREEMVQILMHDLQNPMGNLLSALHELQGSDSREAMSEPLARAENSAKSMLGKIVEILETNQKRS